MDYAEKLDAEIAAARAQVDAIRERAAAGDPIAAILIRRIDQARDAFLATCAKNLLR